MSDSFFWPAKLEEHNFGVTKFSDMSEEEFKRKMLTFKPRTAHDHEIRLNAESHEGVMRKLRGGKKVSEKEDDRCLRRVLA